MKYKTELHAHTSEVSQCSGVSTAKLVETYIQKGYSTLVITNHYSPFTFSHMTDATWQEKNDMFLSSYYLALDAAKGRINIILGMEYRNAYTGNDYLIYGITEDFIRLYSYDDEHNFINMHLKEFTELAHKHGMLVFQAHPFRNGMTIIKPDNLDGIEVLNGHPGHDSRNDIASLWAQKYDLLTCGGSDCHQRGDEAKVALVTDNIIKNQAQLIEALKNKPNIIPMEE